MKNSALSYQTKVDYTEAMKAVNTLEAMGGLGTLNEEQTRVFLTYVFDLSSLKNVVRQVAVEATSTYINKLGIGNRAALPKSEARDPNYRRGVTPSRVTLTWYEIMVPFEISDQLYMQNIEGERIEDTILRMMGNQLGNDLETWFIHGQTTGLAVKQSDIVDGGSTTQYVKDPLLSLSQGWLALALAGGHVVDLENDNVGASTFSKMLNEMPEKYKKDMGKLRFIAAPRLVQNFRERVSARATAAGDNALFSQAQLTPFGVPLVPVALWQWQPPIVEHITFAGGAPEMEQLSYAPIATSPACVLSTTTLGSTPETPRILTTDYTVDATLGQITSAIGGAFNAGGTAKVTYYARPMAMLTAYENLIVAMRKDIRFERDRDIFGGVNQFAITINVGCQVENLDAVVVGKNIGTGV